MQCPIAYSFADERGRQNFTKQLSGLLLLVFIFYSLTLRAGHHWGDDYALYIHHAKNIATGVGYADTGYIADPYYPRYSVRMTPPIFPLALAPVYKIFGLNFTAFKMEEVVFFVLSLGIIFALFRDYLPPPYALLV